MQPQGQALEGPNPVLIKTKGTKPRRLRLKSEVGSKALQGTAECPRGTELPPQLCPQQRREALKGKAPKVNLQAHRRAPKRQRPLGRQIGRLEALQPQGRGAPDQLGANRTQQRVALLLELKAQLGLAPGAQLLEHKLQVRTRANDRAPGLLLTRSQAECPTAELEVGPKLTARHQLTATLAK